MVLDNLFGSSAQPQAHYVIALFGQPQVDFVDPCERGFSRPKGDPVRPQPNSLYCIF